MKSVFVEVVFIDEDSNIIKKDNNLIEEISLKVIEQYVKYINGKIIEEGME